MVGGVEEEGEEKDGKAIPALTVRYVRSGKEKIMSVILKWNTKSKYMYCVLTSTLKLCINKVMSPV